MSSETIIHFYTGLRQTNILCIKWEGPLWSWWVFNATFNNISVISWWSILLMEETRGPGENHQLVASYWQNVVLGTPCLIRIQIDCIGGYKTNYHTITNTTAPQVLREKNKCNYTQNNVVHRNFLNIYKRSIGK